MLMKRTLRPLLLGLALIAVSAALYGAHYLIFHDAHHIFIYMIGDIAFVPIEVLIVTLIIHRLLEWREKKAMMRKLNMPIGLFFSEVGTEFLRRVSSCDRNLDSIRATLTPAPGEESSAIEALRESVDTYEPRLEAGREELKEIRAFLIARRDFMLQLFANPNLLEHETFTDLLWSVFHLTDELAHRHELDASEESDLKHLNGDLARAYGRAMRQWADYMGHLRENYPFLFSFAARNNPFREQQDVRVG